MNTLLVFKKRALYRMLMAWIVLGSIALAPVLVLREPNERLEGVVDLVSRFAGVFNGSSGDRPSSFVALVIYVASFTVVMLIWWRLRELRTLRQIFDLPWRGLGEDVENVGAIESAIRAVAFVSLMLISLLVLSASMGLSLIPRLTIGSSVGKSVTPNGEKAVFDQSEISGSQSGSSDAVKPGDGITNVQKKLIGDHLAFPADNAALELKIDRNTKALTDLRKTIIDRLTEHESETRELNASARHLGALDSISESLKQLAQYPAHRESDAGIQKSLDSMDSQIGTMLRILSNSASENSRIKQRAQLPADGYNCRAATKNNGDAENVLATYAPMAFAASRERKLNEGQLHKIGEFHVFFDPQRAELSPIATRRLDSIIEMVKKGNDALDITGEDDLTSDGNGSESLSLSRARTVAHYIDIHGHPPIIGLGWTRRNKSKESEPYRRIVRMEVLKPC